MKKKTVSKPKVIRKASLLKRSLIVIGVILAVGVTISAYFLARYGVGPLTFLAINPVIAPINGDRWYEGTQITVQSTKTTKTPNGAVTTVKYTESDSKTPEIKQEKTITTAAVVSSAGDRQARTTVTDTNTGAVLVQRQTTDSMGSKGQLATTKTVDVRTNADGTKDTYETTVSYHKDANGNDQKSEVTTKNGEQITQNGVYLPGKEPVKTTSGGTVVGAYDKPNCDAGMCGTNGSPVCSGAYVFTGGNNKDGEGNKIPDTYGCVQCQGGSLSSEVKDCNKLITDGASVVLPYDANNKWLSSIKTEGMTGPCFITRGDTWVQAGIGQVYEGSDKAKQGSVCDGHGGWVPPTTKTNPTSAAPPVSPTTPVTPPVVKKNGVCNGGSMAGLILDAYAISSGGPLGIITGTIDGVRTVINCANAENPSFSFCRSKAGIDKDGNCIADTIVAGAVGAAFGAGVTDPVAVGAATGGIVSSNPELAGTAVGAATGGIALTPAGIAGGIGAAGGVIGSAVGQVVGPVVVQAAKDHPIMTGFGVGCVAGGTAGMILGPIGGIGGCIVGSVVGGITGYSYGNASQESNDSRDGSSLTSPSTLSQGGSGLNTGPINEINSPVNTAGQTGGNSFKHFYQGNYGNGIDKNGCYLTVAAMIVANYGTVDKGKNPEQLNNQYLSGAPVKSGYITVFDGNAYDKNGINLVDVSKEAQGNVSSYVANHATQDQPVTLAIYCDSCYSDGHFVLAVGENSKGEPLIYDPLRKDQTAPIPLNAENYPGLNFKTSDVHIVQISN